MEATWWRESTQMGVCVCVCVANTHTRVVARRSWRHSRADRRADTRPWRHMVVATHGGGDTQSWRHATGEKGKASDGERWVEGAVAVARWRLQQIKGELRTCPDRNAREGDRNSADRHSCGTHQRWSDCPALPLAWRGRSRWLAGTRRRGMGCGAPRHAAPPVRFRARPRTHPCRAGHYLCLRSNSGNV